MQTLQFLFLTPSGFAIHCCTENHRFRVTYLLYSSVLSGPTLLFPKHQSHRDQAIESCNPFEILTYKYHGGAGGTLIAVSSIFSVLFSLVFCSVASAQTPVKTLRPTQQAASQGPGLTEISKGPDPLLAEAKLLVDKGMVSEAERAVRQYLDKHRDSADGHFLLGYILFREIQENAGVKGGTAAATYSEKVGDGSDTILKEAKAKIG